MLKKCLSALLAAVASLSVPAACQVLPPAPQTLPTPLTLNQAISIALRHQPQIYIAHDQITQAQAQKQQAQAQYFPSLTPSYQYQNTSQSVYGLTTSSAVGDTAVGDTANEVNFIRGGGLSVSLSQNLYDGGVRETANAQARHTVDAANFNDLNTRQTTVLTVTQNYYQLLLALDLVKVGQAQVARYQQAVDVTQAQINAGTTAAKNIYQARADLANAQVTLQQNRNQVQNASSSLKNVLGVTTNAVVEPAPLTQGDALPSLPVADQSITLDAAIAAAYANRPDLRQQQAASATQNDALQQAKQAAGLTIRSNYALTYQTTNDIGSRGIDSELLVTGSYPLFDAGSGRGAIRAAQAQRDAAQNQLEQMRQQIRLDVEQAYNTRETNQQAAQLAQAAVTAAQINFDAAVAARREGIGTVLDITVAQTTLTQAQNQYVTAIYDFYIADAQLQRSLGQNDASFR